MSKPTLHYFDVSGRGELSKLIAAVGGVEIDVVEYPFQANGASVADKLKAGKMESAHTKAATEMGMDGCGLPIVVHDDLKIYQSMAVQDYFVSLGQQKNYPKVTAQQKAVDDMFEGTPIALHAYVHPHSHAHGIHACAHFAALRPWAEILRAHILHANTQHHACVRHDDLVVVTTV